MVYGTWGYWGVLLILWVTAACTAGYYRVLLRTGVHLRVLGVLVVLQGTVGYCRILLGTGGIGRFCGVLRLMGGTGETGGYRALQGGY